MIQDLERAVHLVAVHLDRASLGVTQAEAHVLSQLAAGPATVGELHHEFGHKRSTLTNVLDRLEDRGYVVRTVNPTDRRSLVVTTTRAGAAAARRVRKVLDELERAVRAEVSERDLAAVAAVADALRRIS
jgi:MarR family transcriptional regulator, temperature-dependent positive regulator of motility